MADHLDDRLSALSDTPVPALLPAAAVRARGDQRRRRQTAVVGATAVLAIAALGGVALGTGQEPQDALRVASTPNASPSTSPPPSADPTPTAQPTPTAEPTPSETVEPTPSESPSSSPPPPAPPAFPDQAAPEHGSTRTAVYLALAYDSADPELQQAQAQAAEFGYGEVGAGDVSCDQGAREAFGLDPQQAYYGVALYFADRPTAQQFVDAYEPGVVGIATVTTYCLD